ncbi:hypothetical protein N9I19_09680 [Peribacillus sp. CSMR9]|nr:hypothetical protein [Peribacillus sp. CSMR9]
MIMDSVPLIFDIAVMKVFSSVVSFYTIFNKMLINISVEINSLSMKKEQIKDDY